MDNLNINSLSCFKIDEQTNSFFNCFDKISLKNIGLNKFDLVILTNKLEAILFHVEVFLCKEGDDGKLERIVDSFQFNIPKEGMTANREDGTITESDTFIREISIEKLKENGEGRYLLMIFGKKIDSEEYVTQKSYSIKEMEFVSQSVLNVSID